MKRTSNQKNAKTFLWPKTSPKTTFKNRAKPPIFSRRIGLAGIQSFRPVRYVLFLHVNAESRIMPSEVGERAVGAGFMQFYSALSERCQKGQHIVCCLESWNLRTCWRQFAKRSFLHL